MNLFGIPVSFVLFGTTLLSVAIFHKHTLKVALIGLATITLYTLFFDTFKGTAGIEGLLIHLHHEQTLLLNLLALLIGFALLADHFERSHITYALVRYMPNGWLGPFGLLFIIFILSAFLDNIAAAMIGGAIALIVFNKKVHIGYLAAIVAASNAGGAGSVLGDTTTTMMWLAGVSPLDVLHAYVGAFFAFCFFAVFASFQQIKHHPSKIDIEHHHARDYMRLIIVVLALVIASTTNIIFTLHYPAILDKFPVLGIAVWLVLLSAAFVRQPTWNLIPSAFKGSLFLLSLVLCASMMPVDKLPPVNALSTFGLGFLSSVFDNIPLTALALKQGGYDWGCLAFSVGFGGSMLWFGSSAGVSLSNLFPEIRSVFAWLRYGWHIPVGYIIGYGMLLLVWGWHPHAPIK